MTIPLSLLAVHFVGDFLLQADWMAQGKSKNTRAGLIALTTHVLVYSLCFMWLGFYFTALTFVTHWATDFVTSRITSRLIPFVPDDTENSIELYNMNWQDGRSNHWFFVTIGFDQLLHYTTLALTYVLLFGV